METIKKIQHTQKKASHRILLCSPVIQPSVFPYNRITVNLIAVIAENRLRIFFGAKFKFSRPFFLKQQQ